jgi:hypothetical protein
MNRELSLDYLIKFLEFCKNKLNYNPIILGGWAVYVLTKKEMSVDVDVLLKSKEDIGKIKEFFDRDNFKIEIDRKGNITFEKILESHMMIDDVKINSIIFDIMLEKEENFLHENKNISIPWSLSFKYNKNIKYKEVDLKIPLPELLLIYKIKAYRDRTFDKFKFMEHMKHKKIWQTRKDFKINKDKRDILNLLELVKLDSEIINKILNKTSFRVKFNETFNEINKF